MLVIAICAAVAAFGSRAKAAQDYPSRPITIVVPYAAGGASDTVARILAERMRTLLRQPVIVDNTSGAAGRIGTGRVARAIPDGHTIIAASSSTHVMNGAIYALNFDVVKDFVPISLLVDTPQVIVAKKSMPANDLNELIRWLKANPDKAAQGTTGVGGTSHLAGVFFQQQTGTRFRFVPYRGGAMQDLVAGHIDLMIDQASNALPQVRIGSIKAYAVAAKSRLAVAREIPTTDEAGVPNFHMSVWHAFFAPKGTPKPIIAQLNTAVTDALADRAIRQRLAEIGQSVFPPEQQAPEALAAFHKAEIEKWWPIINAAGIKVE